MVCLNPHFPELASYPWEQLPQQFDHMGTLIYDSRNQVRDVEIEGQHLIVKRFHRPLLHQRIDYTFLRQSKARRAYEFGIRLTQLGISTPTPIACIETRRWGIYADGLLVTLPCYNPDLRILRREPDRHPDLIDALARFLISMHEAGFMHGDPNLSNFLYNTDSSGHVTITTIDINRSRFVCNPTRQQCLAGLTRLTHIRQLLQDIVSRYANLRGWDAGECVEIVFNQLDRFERRKRAVNKLKGK